jgi:serine/threonine protein kinase
MHGGAWPREGRVTLAGQGTLVGERLGQYQLEGLLGAGGMAEVYRARNLGRDGPREVAVKVLPASLASDVGYVRRFREEADRVASLKHPSIVPVLDSNEQRGLLYLVMPLLKESLRDRLEREERLTPSEAVGIARQIASALAVAHDAGLIHRDVKPENILLDGKGQAMLTDFGIARQIAPRRGGTLYTVSGSGLPVGTPEYMPPEQLRADHIDQRADIYALGAVLYELLTGTVPYPADTPYEVAALVFTAPLAPPSAYNREIPPQLEQVVVTALAKNPAERFQDARTFERALQTATAPPGLFERAGLRRNLITQRFSRPDTAAGRMAPSAITGAPTLPPATLAPGMPTQRPPAWPPVGPTRTPAQPRPARGRWLLVGGILALLAVTACGGGSLAAASKLGLILSSSATPTVDATATLIPTDTPEPTETATIEPTVTPVPIPLLTNGPFTWPSPSVGSVGGHTVCKWTGQQQVTNPSGGQTLTWHWQAIEPGPNNFKWGLGSSASNLGLPIDNGQSPGAQQKLSVFLTTSLSGGLCPSSGPKYTVTMFDSLNRSYTFTMQPS